MYQILANTGEGKRMFHTLLHEVRSSHRKIGKYLAQCEKRESRKFIERRGVVKFKFLSKVFENLKCFVYCAADAIWVWKNGASSGFHYRKYHRQSGWSAGR